MDIQSKESCNTIEFYRFFSAGTTCLFAKNNRGKGHNDCRKSLAKQACSPIFVPMAQDITPFASKRSQVSGDEHHAVEDGQRQSLTGACAIRQEARQMGRFISHSNATELSPLLRVIVR